MRIVTRASRKSAGILALAALVCNALILSAQSQEASTPTQSTPRWDSLPLMQLEAFYRGPLTDTVIQRWRDPVDGSVCYIYMPISSEHARTPNSPYVQYGSNQIGSISCFAQQGAAASPMEGHNKSAGTSKSSRTAKPN